MVQLLHGITINASSREELSVSVVNEYLYLKTSNINGRIIETRHEKPKGISDKEMLMDFENLFRAHNESVVSMKNKLRLDTINSIQGYCVKHTENIRREQYQKQIQKNIFDIKFDLGVIRITPKYLMLFEGFGDVPIPIIFELTSSEYEGLEKIYTTF